ncbi:phosphoenolpyruvate--protein phosphotransferase [Myxococcota bacterium]
MSRQSNEWQSETPSSVPPSPAVIDGIPGSPGLAVGSAMVVDTRRPGVSHRHVARRSVEDELERFERAVERASQDIREVASRLRISGPRSQASILDAYVAMVEDESLHELVERHIRIDLQCAEWALDSAVTELASQLRAVGDPYLAERSHDFEFVGDRILRTLMGRQLPIPLIPALEAACILVAHDLSPAETAALSKDRVKAIVTEVGTRTSHTAILARALEIPAVVGVKRITALVGSGEQLVVDGQRGRVVISPTPAMVEDARARARRCQSVIASLRENRHQPAALRSGEGIELMANLELPGEADVALEQGAQGVGLYRTEFLYIARAEPPSEDEQYAVYRYVAERMAPLPVVLRTFDIGGDKFASAFQAPAEMNPALGLRAVRLGLARPELLLIQLRAMVRASDRGNISIMVPMVSALDELRAVQQLLAQAIVEVDQAGHPRAPRIPLGIMVEVPAAALLAEEFSREADFFSIGTNDLIQYALAVDRTNQELAHLASGFHPAILRLVKQVAEAGRRAGKPVSVCGVMASDPIAACVLVGLGLRQLSVESSSLLEVKAALARVSLAEAQTVAGQALAQLTTSEGETAVRTGLAPLLHGLVDQEGD